METLVLTGASLIDGTGAEPVRGRAVVVEGDRITQVVDDARAPRGRRIDLSGSTLLPGLINCHVHLCFGAEADPVRALKDEPLALTALKALRRAQETVEAGVTTVRDLGGRDYVELAVRRAIAEGLFPGPRILGAGRPVCMTGGHGNFVGREADGPDDVRKAVREQLKAGVDVIKLIATGGVMTPGSLGKVAGLVVLLVLGGVLAQRFGTPMGFQDVADVVAQGRFLLGRGLDRVVEDFGKDRKHVLFELAILLMELVEACFGGVHDRAHALEQHLG